MTYGNRMEQSGTAWLTPRPGCGVPLEDGSGTILRTGDRISADDPVARKWRHRLMLLSAAPIEPPPEEEDDDG